jgi:UDP-glucose 4-epimerase
LRFFVTGCAGFIGSNLTVRLLAAGHDIIGFANLSTGLLPFLEGASHFRHFALVQGDALDATVLARAMAGTELVFHLAANADVRFGTQHPRRDLEQNTIAIVNLLDAMPTNGIGHIAYACTGSVCGEAQVFPTPQNAAFAVQNSLYADSKIAAEGFIEAYCEGFDLQACIFRFVSTSDERYTHRHVFDVYKQLQVHPDYLEVPRYQGGERDSDIRSLGWRPKLAVREAVVRAVSYLQQAPTVLEARI